MEASDMIKVQATEANINGIVNVRISYSSGLQEAIDKLIPAVDLEKETEGIELTSENNLLVLKFKCHKTKLTKLLSVTKDVLNKIQSIIDNKSNSDFLLN